MKISAQDYIILAILDAMETNTYSRSMRQLCNVKYSLTGKSPYIEFSRKDGRDLEPKDVFWLGFFVREYL